jgi:hypothetical protein
VQRANIHPGDFYPMYIAQAANKLWPRDSLKCTMLQRNAARCFAFHLAAIMHSVEHCTWLLLSYRCSLSRTTITRKHGHRELAALKIGAISRDLTNDE